MKGKVFNINGGLYLVIDPLIPLSILAPKLKAAIEGGVDIIQIWNNWKKDAEKLEIIKTIAEITHQHNIPLVINEQMEWINSEYIDGIHFDEIPANFNELKSAIRRSAIMGITCGNDFNTIAWAVENKLDYISFCSVFPSNSVSTCNWISREIMYKARAFTDIPIFLAGGINQNNIYQLKDTGFDGIAIMSGIMGAIDVKRAAQEYKAALINIKTEL